MRRLVILVALVASAVVLVPSSASTAPAPPVPDPPGAFAAGGTPVAQLPVCTDVTPDHPGVAGKQSDPQFGPEDSRSRVCQATPSKIDHEAARPTHHTNGLGGYHFASVETSTPRNRQGVRSKINSVNPNVCHPCAVGDAMFVAEWVMAADRRPNASNFIQTGWIERAQEGNTRLVFHYDTAIDATLYYSQFVLTDGNTNGASYAVRHTATGFGWQWTTYVWYNSAWRALRSQYLDLPPNDGTVTGENTSMIASEEVFINPATTGTSSDYHPCVPEHINTGTQVYVEPFNTWINWTYDPTPYGTAHNDPYNITLPYSGTAEVWTVGGGC